MENKPATYQIPEVLYQYRPPTKWAFDSLSRRVLYFGSPVKFNDPYDCLPPLFGNFTEEDKKSLMELARRRNRRMGIKSQEEGEKMTSSINDSILRKWNKIRTKLGIACFSEHHDNLLMWSHYGGCGRGFCLAFDTLLTKGFQGKYTREVQYPKDISHGATSIILDGENGILDWLSRKSEAWAYEREWRVFMTPRSKDKKARERCYSPEIIKAIYLGTEAKPKMKARIRSIVEEIYPHAELWQGRLSNTEYKVEFKKIR